MAAAASSRSARPEAWAWRQSWRAPRRPRCRRRRRGLRPEPWQVWNAVIDRCIDVGIDGLTDRERTVYLINAFLCDLENGPYLFNFSPSNGGRQWTELRGVADAAEALGERAAATVLREMSTLFESADVSAGATWDEFFTLADPDRKRDRLEAALHQKRGDLWDRLEAYTVEHFGARPFDAPQ